MSQLVRNGLVLAGIAAVSVLGGLVASAALGMSASETGHVAALLVPAGLATVGAAVVAARALAGSVVADPSRGRGPGGHRGGLGEPGGPSAWTWS